MKNIFIQSFRSIFKFRTSFSWLPTANPLNLIVTRSVGCENSLFDCLHRNLPTMWKVVHEPRNLAHIDQISLPWALNAFEKQLSLIGSWIRRNLEVEFGRLNLIVDCILPTMQYIFLRVCQQSNFRSREKWLFLIDLLLFVAVVVAFTFFVRGRGE